MWYLNRGHKLDMNVQEAWHQGATGEGISVTILDDGIERSHPDLVANYDPLASYDVNQNDNDPTPRYDLIDSNRHGKKLLHSVKIVDIYSHPLCYKNYVKSHCTYAVFTECFSSNNGRE